MFQCARIKTMMLSLLLASACAGCAAARPHEISAQSDRDKIITARVKAAILDVSTLQVYVQTNNGVVQLSGFVDSAQRVTRTGNIARSVENVISVDNDLVVNCGVGSSECVIRTSEVQH